MSYPDSDILPTSLAMILNEITKSNLKKRKGVVRVLTALSEMPFESLLVNFRELGIEIDCEEIAREGDFELWSCTAARRLPTYEFVLTGSFHVLKRKLSTFFISGERGIFFRHFIRPMTRIAYPDLLRGYILTEEIFKLLDDFSKTIKTPLRYNEFWYKKLFGEAFTDRRHEKRWDIEKYGIFEEAFLKAREEGGWLDRINVFGGNFDFSIDRNGVLKFRKGAFSDYYHYFLSRIIDVVSARWKLFEKKGRAEQPEYEVKPILVEFENVVFDDVELKKQFIQELSRYPNCSYSIIHGGNPHLYLSILDRVDNSSFSIRTYGTNALLISPQIRTTKAALVRFSTYLLNNFQEGKMVEFQA
jgi:hypothetical protein